MKEIDIKNGKLHNSKNIGFEPMAVRNDGNIVFQGSYERLLKCKESVTKIILRILMN